MIDLTGVSKRYGSEDIGTMALRDVTLHIRSGESVAIVGPSGSGKSTLLNILGLLTTPTSGEVIINGVRTTHLTSSAAARMRNETIGFVLQNYGLLPDLTVWENVELPLLYGSGRNKSKTVAEALKTVGMDEYGSRKPRQLSGGQQQRVAIARALVTNAPILLADEPTGALDTATGRTIIDHLHRECERGKTLLIVTHDPTIASACQRIIRVRDGAIVSEQTA